MISQAKSIRDKETAGEGVLDSQWPLTLFKKTALLGHVHTLHLPSVSRPVDVPPRGTERGGMRKPAKKRHWV